MRDFSVVSAKTFLKVTSVSPIRGLIPVSVIVSGERLNLAKEVFYNDFLSPEFLIVSPSRLIVRVPPAQVGKEFRSVTVTSTVPLSRAGASITLEASRPIGTLRGIDRLVQSWLLIFLTTPGSDAFDPQSGGGAKTIVGRSTDRNHKGVAADLGLAVERTQTELLRLQSKGRNIPLDERLLSSDLESLSFDEATTAIAATVSIKNMLGERADVDVR